MKIPLLQVSIDQVSHQLWILRCIQSFTEHVLSEAKLYFIEIESSTIFSPISGKSLIWLLGSSITVSSSLFISSQLLIKKWSQILLHYFWIYSIGIIREVSISNLATISWPELYVIISTDNSEWDCRNSKYRSTGLKICRSLGRETYFKRIRRR